MLACFLVFGDHFDRQRLAKTEQNTHLFALLVPQEWLILKL